MMLRVTSLRQGETKKSSLQENKKRVKNREEKGMKHRKLLLWSLAAAIALTPLSGSVYAEPAESEAGTGDRSTFKDINGHWAEKIIKEAAELNIVGGYPDGSYLPDNLIKREEFFKLLTNILTVVPDTSGTVVKFTDVDMDEWYMPTIRIAVAGGITSGYGDGTFGIGQMISRQEAAKVAGSVISKDVKRDALGAESAVDKEAIADWAFDYVDLMFKKGYMKGDTEGNFRPTMALTRAEAATILLNIKKSEPIIAANAEMISESNCVSTHSGQDGLFTAGKGTESEPYEISTEAQLNHIRKHVSEGAFYILKKNIAITVDYVNTAPADRKDTDWSEGNLAPIGSKTEPFVGSLDGNGYTISGLNISGTEGSGDSKRTAGYAGLFGYLAKGSAIKELTIDASNITGNQYTGAIAGYSDGKIENCELGSKGIIKGQTYTGGLAGYSSQPIKGLTNRGTVTGTQSDTGGIAGAVMTQGTAVSDCRNYGEVSGSDKTGGLVGSFHASIDGVALIKDSENRGTVKGASYQAGGIAGYVGAGYYNTTVETCVNAGQVTGTGVNGGIVGWLAVGKSVITKCTNTGTVEGSGAGGIVGKSEGTISSCYNTGTVISDLSSGGIAAYQLDSGGKILLCYNEGNVLANCYAGGIAGENNSRIENAYNSGKVRGAGTGGGIAGKNTGTVVNTYGAGTVTSEKNAGSLIGRNSGTVANSFWLNTSSPVGLALEDNVTGQQSVVKVTHEELSGQKKIKTLRGFVMLIEVLNQKQEVWEYLYRISIPAPGSTSVLSDGGSVVAPIEVSSEDPAGNIIDPADLNTKYLYPGIID
jgi:hypothetical protein